ncbi:hypothetical protein PMAYCL1PPCAC_25021 [Pristionchus mayeri]|uniref:Uncharacterized protein n=1 Tax=Pristionchus mayeri TaxID=1317129 RepID=A0AAN5I9C1_9BILA|nr:hypothetical protein PMAYCL1PPCAC_25021 [Pristionchus mayeri]
MMGVRIFFKDKTNDMKGLFTEHQIQKWYREKWFESDFPFYFTQNDERPSDEENSGITLGILRSLNGVGCPFFKVDENEEREREKKRREREEKLQGIEKKITELRQLHDVILSIKKKIDGIEADVEVGESGSSSAKKILKEHNEKTFDKPESIPDDIWKNLCELGVSFADLVMNAFDVYATGRFAGWDKKRLENIESTLYRVKKEMREGRNLACEHILIEKMKEKEFFCCSICDDESFYNYKQALIHFTSKDHRQRETGTVRKSGIDSIRHVLDMVTKLPAKLAEDDARVEKDRKERNGPVDLMKRVQEMYRPEMTNFGAKLMNAYREAHYKNRANCIRADMDRMSRTVFDTMHEVEIMKGEFGRKMFPELHEHLGQGETFCSFCSCVTGDRDGFYAHYISSSHLRVVANAYKNAGQECRIDTFTVLVNVYKKDLI